MNDDVPADDVNAVTKSEDNNQEPEGLSNIPRMLDHNPPPEDVRAPLTRQGHQSSYVGTDFENSLVLFNRVIIEGSSTAHGDEDAYGRAEEQLPATRRRDPQEPQSSGTRRRLSSFFSNPRRYDAAHRSKRVSVPACLGSCSEEPIHVTLEEVRSWSCTREAPAPDGQQHRRNQRRGSNWSYLKRAFKGLFGHSGHSEGRGGGGAGGGTRGDAEKTGSLTRYEGRALPPVPSDSQEDGFQDESRGGLLPYHNEQYRKYMDNRQKDFASSIQKVKDYGWYWGPLSGETAERILANEPDGSFIVRDSSDEHYIFSLTFKLNGLIRHVRIEHDQGNFSFGTLTNFKSHTIVEFIQNAVEHSRSGRYLFFLHHRPVLGPMRVQLLYPVSRFKQVQSLQHMCRFVILKVVRRDLISGLPLPKRIKDYLNTRQYYSEVAEEMQRSVVESPTRSLIARAPDKDPEDRAAAEDT